MEILYSRSILYAYGCLDALIEQIDELVVKKALGSMDNFKPCLSQCESIINLTEQKDKIIELKITCDKILHKFSSQEIDCLDYKYFKKKPKEYYSEFDFYSRAYFRRQIRLAKKFATLLEKEGFTDQIFEKEYLQIDFFKELFKRVKRQEENAPNRRRFIDGKDEKACAKTSKRDDVTKGDFNAKSQKEKLSA